MDQKSVNQPPGKYFPVRDWHLIVVEGISYQITPGLDVKNASCAVESDERGRPIIVLEPTLAFDPPANLRYINAKGEVLVPDQKIAGIICKGKGGLRGKLTELSNVGMMPKVNPDGSLQIGEEVWWISTLFIKDRDCFRNYDAICFRENFGDVDVLDIGEIIDFILDGDVTI